jgi:hypothetical protein
MSDEDVLGELQRLAWVAPGADQPGTVVGQIATSPAPAEADSIMRRAVPPSGRGTARNLPAQQAPATDSTADTAESEAEVLNHTNGVEQPPLRPVVAAPAQPCQHCAGSVPGKHQDGCVTFEPDGRLKVTQGFVIGDPR